MAGKVADQTVDELLTYKKDPRTACKYGSGCYQKNPLHNKKYKHPPVTPKRQLADSNNGPAKKQKGEEGSFQTAVVPKQDKGEKNDFGTGCIAQQSKREEISDSDSDTARSPKIVEEKPMESQDKKKDIICDSDPNSPTPHSTVERQVIRDSASTREQISDSDSDSPPTQKVCATKSPRTEDVLQPESEPDIPMLSLPQDAKRIIKQMFLVEMPEDFYSFWSFCMSLSKSNPADAFKDVGLLMVGPFDVLSGKLGNYCPEKRDSYLTHWRYYYDPPEFQTIIKGDDKTQFHMGYYRDDPTTPPCFVASNCAATDGIIRPMAENIFGAVNSFLESAQKTSNPFLKVKFSRMQKVLQAWAKDKDYDLAVITPHMKSRDRKVVTKTFHRAGIVVPLEKKTELGYRELIETDSRLKKILKFVVESKTDEERNIYLEKLQPIITAANIANDECDFGTSLELGLDLFTFGGQVLHGSILQLLTTAYTLLKRPEFKQIIVAHLQQRRKGTALSMINGL